MRPSVTRGLHVRQLAWALWHRFVPRPLAPLYLWAGVFINGVRVYRATGSDTVATNFGLTRFVLRHLSPNSHVDILMVNGLPAVRAHLHVDEMRANAERYGCGWAMFGTMVIAGLEQGVRRGDVNVYDGKGDLVRIWHDGRRTYDRACG